MTVTVAANDYFSKGSGTVTLCGSTKFFEQCMEANRILTFQHWIVLMCGSWGHSYHKDATPLARDYSLIKQLHFHKILESDAIVVVSDESEYIGESTREEIAFSQHRNKAIFYYDGNDFSGSAEIHSIPDKLADNSLISNWRGKYTQN